MKAVIPAAGRGTRFLPYTRSQPKEMLPVVDKPAIQYVVEEAIASGIQEILIVTARGKRAIEDHFDRNVELDRLAQGYRTRPSGVEEILNTARVFYVRQTEHLGLGHAVLITEKFVGGEPFSVLLGDDLTFGKVPCQQALLGVHARKGSSVLAIQKVPKGMMGRYGMVVGNEEEDGIYRIGKIIEKPRPEQVVSRLATLGRYVFTPAIFQSLRRTKPDAGGEIQLTEAISDLLRQEDVYAYLYEGRRYDIGDKMGWLRANLEIAAVRPELSKSVRQMIANLSKSVGK